MYSISRSQGPKIPIIIRYLPDGSYEDWGRRGSSSLTELESAFGLGLRPVLIS